MGDEPHRQGVITETIPKTYPEVTASTRDFLTDGTLPANTSVT